MTGVLAARESALDEKPLEIDTPANRVGSSEDERFAGPAPDGAVLIDQQAHMSPLISPAASLLRFITCGSVDDGKSTLIGRLLFETNAVFDDQMEALERDSRKFGTTGSDLDFALLVDGLSAEREQGITIDVAYRYFSTQNRAFIIADTPGHEQYTRNMATGASQAELAVILVDARKGILPQTRRHSFIVSLVGIKSVVIAINKMDLVDFAQERFEAIKASYAAILPSLGFTDVAYIPLSAKNGDNMTSPSPNMPWYGGETLLQRLESVNPQTFEAGNEPFRLPVQWVNRPNLDFRGFSGQIVGGRVAAGDAIKALPSGQTARVKAVLGPSGEQASAEAGEAVTLTLTDEIDVSRGDVLVAPGDAIAPRKTLAAEILWMVDRPLVSGGRLVAKLGSAQTPATVRSLDDSVDIHSYERRPTNTLQMNEIGRVTMSFDRPVVAVPYAENRELGSFILIDPLSNETVALGIVRSVEAARRETAPAVETQTSEATGLARLGEIWFGPLAKGSTVRRSALVRSRALTAVFIAFIAFLFGLALPLAVLLGALDLVLRPFLDLAFGGNEPPPARNDRPDEIVQGGEGI